MEAKKSESRVANKIVERRSVKSEEAKAAKECALFRGEKEMKSIGREEDKVSELFVGDVVTTSKERNKKVSVASKKVQIVWCLVSKGSV